MQPAQLEPYLAGKEIFLAPSRDKKGQEMARYLAEHFPKAKPIQPDYGDSWNEHRLHQIKEQNEAREKEWQAKPQPGREPQRPSPPEPGWGLGR